MTRRALLATTGQALVGVGLAGQSPPAEGARAGDAREVEGVGLRWCPPGRFAMGSPPTETSRRADEAQVDVTLTRGFWMAAFETTQGQWQRIVGAFPDRPPTEAFGLGEAFPMYWVNYAEAEGFCRALTERARRASDHSGERRSSGLPTEAQWEYALPRRHDDRNGLRQSRAPRRRELQIDPGLDGDGPPSPGRATPAGAFRANAWGLHDMYGNIFEWCRDWYHATLPGGVDPDVQVKGRAEPRRQLLARPPRRRRGTTKRTRAARRCACATSRSAAPITSGSASSSWPSESGGKRGGDRHEVYERIRLRCCHLDRTGGLDCGRRPARW